MKIIFIRHADPNYEKDTLTETGFKEAKALGKYLKNKRIDKLYSSPLSRAILTTKEINKYHKLGVEICDWLKEFNYPVYEPSVKKIKGSWDILPSYFVNQKEFYDYENLFNHPMYKDTNLEEKYNETVTLFNNLLTQFGYKKEGKLYKVLFENDITLVFVCHLGLMNVLLSTLLNIPYILLCQTFFCPPSGITLLNSEEREKGIAQFRCEHYGATPHLAIDNLEDSFSGRFCECFSDKTRH